MYTDWNLLNATLHQFKRHAWLRLVCWFFIDLHNSSSVIFFFVLWITRYIPWNWNVAETLTMRPFENCQYNSHILHYWKHPVVNSLMINKFLTYILTIMMITIMVNWQILHKTIILVKKKTSSCIIADNQASYKYRKVNCIGISL